MTRQEAFDKTIALFNDFLALEKDVMNASAYHGDVYDFRQITRFCEKLWSFSRYILTESFFVNLSDGVEDEKSIFLTNKAAKRFFDEIFLKEIGYMIDVSTRVQFHDYRARNLQSDTRRLMEEIRDFYVEMYR